MNDIAPHHEAEQQLPARFLVGAQRVGEYLRSLDLPGDAAERAQAYSDLMSRSGSLVQAAQSFEFVRMVPELEGSPVIDATGQILATELEDESVPEGIRAIYRELYAQDVAPYLTATIQS